MEARYSPRAGASGGHVGSSGTAEVYAKEAGFEVDLATASVWRIAGLWQRLDDASRPEPLALRVGDVRDRDGAIVDFIYLTKAMTNGREARAVPVSPLARVTLEELIAWKSKRGESLDRAAPLFLSRAGGFLSRRQAHAILKITYEKAGLNGKLACHVPRKTAANALHEKEVSLLVIKELLGYESVSTTEQYIGVGVRQLVDAVGQLGGDD